MIRIVLGILVLGITGITIIGGIKKSSNLLTSPNPTEINPLGIEIPSEVFSYRGKVKNISDTFFEIDAKAQDNFLKNDAIIKVSVGPDTGFAILVNSLGSSTTSTSDINAIFQSQQASFYNMKTGNEVLVSSDHNIKDKTEFTARAVHIISR